MLFDKAKRRTTGRRSNALVVRSSETTIMATKKNIARLKRKWSLDRYSAKLTKKDMFLNLPRIAFRMFGLC